MTVVVRPSSWRATSAGMSATDNQCASGMCDPVGLSGALVYFEACDSRR